MLKDLLFSLLRCPSITPNEAGCFDIAANALDDFKRFDINKADTSNILLRKEFNPNGKIHFVFGTHADVVPASGQWQSDPFTPVLKDGYIYARGAADMKAGLAAAIMAAKSFKASDNEQIASISLLITSDEEGDGTYGSAYALEQLAKQGIHFSDALITEPTCDKFFGDTIKTARRGSVHIELKFIGKGGHIAYAKQCNNPIELASVAICALAGMEFDQGFGVFEPSKLVISNIHCGDGSLNVSPQELIIKANVRNNSLSNEASIKEQINRVCKSLDAVKSGLLRFELLTRTSSLPFNCDENSAIVSALKQAISQISGVVPNCNAAGGTSDARHFAAFGANTCEFGPRNESIHAINEHVSYDEVIKCEQIYLQVLRTIRSN